MAIKISGNNINIDGEDFTKGDVTASKALETKRKSAEGIPLKRLRAHGSASTFIDLDSAKTERGKKKGEAIDIYVKDTYEALHISPQLTSIGPHPNVPLELTGSIAMNGPSMSFTGSNVNFDTEIINVAGSMDVSGSLSNTGSLDISGSLFTTGSMDITGSFGATGSMDITGSFGATGSMDVSGSFGATGSMNITGSFNSTGSMNITGSFNSTGSMDITGSMELTGSFGATGSVDWDLTGSAWVNGITIGSNPCNYEVSCSLVLTQLENSGAFCEIGVRSGSVYSISNNTGCYGFPDTIGSNTEAPQSEIVLELPAIANVGPGFSYHIKNKHNFNWQSNVTMSIKPNANDRFLYTTNGQPGIEGKKIYSITPSGYANSHPWIKFSYGNADGWMITDVFGSWTVES